MPFFFKTLSALLATIVLASFPSVAFAGHMPVAALGSQGRQVVNVECPSGEVLKGFQGRIGGGIDRLQMLCAPLRADGTTDEIHAYGDGYGGFGGGAMPAETCNPTSRIAAAHVALTVDGGMVFGINLVCVDRAGNVTDKIEFVGEGDKISRAGGVVARKQVPVLAGAATQYGAVADYSCPDENFTGIRVRFDTAVRGLGFICDRVTPAATAPPPQKVLRATGKPKAAPASGPIIAHPSLLRGAWNTKTSSDGYFTVILTPAHDGMGPLAGQPIPVTGQFINAQGAHDYDGTLQGVIHPYSRTLVYSYVQKNGASGTGVFTLSNDGNSITGSGKAGDVEFTWNGTRAK